MTQKAGPVSIPTAVDLTTDPNLSVPSAPVAGLSNPIYAPDINEYENRDEALRVRPRPELEPALAEALRNARRRRPEPKEVSPLIETNEDDKALIAKYKADPHSLLELERLALGWVWHESWFVEVKKRCPGCGEDAVPVGSNFRIPARKDEKEWREVEKWIEAGEDLVAKFVCCVTVEQHKDRVEKAIEIRAARGAVDVPYSTPQWLV